MYSFPRDLEICNHEKEQQIYKIKYNEKNIQNEKYNCKQ